MSVLGRILTSLALLAGLAAVIVPADTAAAASSVQPEHGTAGSRFTFTADGYNAGERVSTWINTPADQPQDVPALTLADGSGRATWQWSAPFGAAPGTWRMVGQGRVSRVSNVIAVQIDGAGPTAGSAPAQGASPASGGPGTSFMLTAGGYTPGERLDTWANTPSGAQRDVPAWTFADNAGIATWNWTAPADAEGGTWQLIGRGIDSRQLNIISVQIAAGAPQPTPIPSQNQAVTPASGPPNTVFAFAADGFRPQEDINFWATSPAGTPEAQSKQVKADDNGHAAWAWVAAADAASGTWVMTAQGAASAVIRQISFAVTAASASAPADGVLPTSGVPGTSFHFGFSGFEHEAKLTYWTISADGIVSDPVAPFRADRNGHVEFDWIAPGNAAGGQWQMVAFSLDRRTTHSVFFRIERDTPPAPPSQGVTPSNGTYGDELHFFVEGLRKNMIVGFWATDPAGVVVPIGREAMADQNGRVEWSWVIPQGVRTGLWTMSIRRSHNDRSEGDDITRSIRFEVR